jgi:hypothetical protein
VALYGCAVSQIIAARDALCSLRAPSGQQDEEILFVQSSPHLLRIKRSIDR